MLVHLKRNYLDLYLRVKIAYDTTKNDQAVAIKIISRVIYSPSLVFLESAFVTAQD